MRHFVPNFAELIKHINVLLKKDAEFKWWEEAKKYFSEIKFALTEVPNLVNPNFEKYFLIFSYASEEKIAVFLIQKNKEC